MSAANSASDAGALIPAGEAEGALVVANPQTAIVPFNSRPLMLPSFPELRPDDDFATVAARIPNGVRVHQAHQLVAMQSAINARDALVKAKEQAAAATKLMESTENTLRMGMFLMALYFFRGCYQLSKLRGMLTGDADAQGLYYALRGQKKESKDPESLALALDANSDWAVRKRAEAAARAKRSRAAAKAFAEAKAAAGFIVLASKAASAAKIARRTKREKEAKRLRKYQAACTIQRFWRGHLARKLIARELLDRHLAVLEAKRRQEAATRIQAAWRGKMARVLAKDYKLELEAFLKLLRKKLANEVLDAYYEANPMEETEKNIRTAMARSQAERDKLAIRMARKLDDQEAKDEIEAADDKAKQKYMLTSVIAKLTQPAKKEPDLRKAASSPTVPSPVSASPAADPSTWMPAVLANPPKNRKRAVKRTPADIIAAAASASSPRKYDVIDADAVKDIHLKWAAAAKEMIEVTKVEKAVDNTALFAQLSDTSSMILDAAPADGMRRVGGGKAVNKLEAPKAEVSRAGDKFRDEAGGASPRKGNASPRRGAGSSSPVKRAAGGAGAT